MMESCADIIQADDRRNDGFDALGNALLQLLYVFELRWIQRVVASWLVIFGKKIASLVDNSHVLG